MLCLQPVSIKVSSSYSYFFVIYHLCDRTTRHTTTFLLPPSSDHRIAWEMSHLKMSMIMLWCRPLRINVVLDGLVTME